jgi:hypothetical protein
MGGSVKRACRMKVEKRHRDFVPPIPPGFLLDALRRMEDFLKVPHRKRTGVYVSRKSIFVSTHRDMLMQKRISAIPG